MTLEIAVFHDKMKYKCFTINGGKKETQSCSELKHEKSFEEYLNILENFKLRYINKNTIERYLNYSDFENLLTMEMQHNILVKCIIVNLLFDLNFKF